MLKIGINKYFISALIILILLLSPAFVADAYYGSFLFGRLYNPYNIYGLYGNSGLFGLSGLMGGVYGLNNIFGLGGLYGLGNYSISNSLSNILNLGPFSSLNSSN